MLGWIMSKWKNNRVQTIGVGAKVNTPHGTGQVTGGCINVRLDVPNPSIDQFSVTHPIDKIELL